MGRFPSTQWSIVVRAGGADPSPGARAALATLCEAYWYPLYAYVRSQGRGVEDAQDLTQGFFAMLVKHHGFGALAPEKGRFRAYLLAAMNHYLANDWHRGRAAKRGGGRTPAPLEFGDAEGRFRAEPADGRTPERVYERRWALTVLESVLASLRSEMIASGKEDRFEALKPFLTGEGARGGHEAAARRLGMTPGAVKVAAHRLRGRYRDLLRSAIAETVARAEDVDGELRYLMRALGD